MAIIQFGAIVTDARGKLGGHTFRKSRSTNVLQRTATVRNADFYEKNRQLQQLQYVSSSFRGLSVSDKAAVANFASKNPIPDRFGTPHVLTSRNMWQLLASNLYFAKGTLPNVQDLCNRLSPFIYTIDERTDLTVNISNVSISNYLLLKAYIVSNCVNYYPTNLFVLQKRIPQIVSGINIDLSEYLNSNVLQYALSKKLVVQLQEVNQSGWAGAPAMFVFQRGESIDF